MIPSSNHASATLEAGAVIGEDGRKTRLIGGLSVYASGETVDIKMAVSEDVRRLRGSGVLSLCKEPFSKSTRICVGGGGGMLSINRGAERSGLGVMGRATGETFLGSNVSLVYGFEIGTYEYEREIPITPLVEAAGGTFDSEGTSLKNRQAYVKARISSDRDHSGMIFYVEPSAVYERIKDGDPARKGETDVDFTASVNVGVATSAF